MSKKYSSIPDPFEEMLKIGRPQPFAAIDDSSEERYDAPDSYEPDAQSPASSFEPEEYSLDEAAAEDAVDNVCPPSVKFPENTISRAAALKIIGFSTIGAIALAALVLLFLFTYTIPLGISNSGFIKYYNSVSIKNVDMQNDAVNEYYAAFDEPIISGADVTLGDDEHPTFATNDSFYISVERGLGGITALTFGAKDCPGYDYETGSFTDNESGNYFVIHLWKSLAGINEEYADFTTGTALAQRIMQSFWYGQTSLTDGDYTFTFDFDQGLYIRVERTRRHYAIWPEKPAADIPVGSGDAQ